MEPTDEERARELIDEYEREFYKERDVLKEQARKELAEYDRELREEGCGMAPLIVPRSEAIIRLRQVLVHELIQPDAEGVIFEGFKGVNEMTNKELSERLSVDPPPFNCIVWDDHDFHLLFGERCRANRRVLSKMGLWDGPTWER